MTSEDVIKSVKLLEELRAVYHDRDAISRGLAFPADQNVWEDYSHMFRDPCYAPRVFPAAMKIVAECLSARIKVIHTELANLGVSLPDHE